MKKLLDKGLQFFVYHEVNRELLIFMIKNDKNSMYGFRKTTFLLFIFGDSKCPSVNVAAPPGMNLEKFMFVKQKRGFAAIYFDIRGLRICELKKNPLTFKYDWHNVMSLNQ